jgi:hypothetical protein
MIERSGDHVYVAGFFNKPGSSGFDFKSYGNVDGGTAVVQKIPLSNLLRATPPTSSDFAWTQTFPGLYTSKGARHVSSGASTAAPEKVVVLLYGELYTKHATVAVLDASSGKISWGPKDYSSFHGEGTDIQVSSDQTSLLLSGQGHQKRGKIWGQLLGQITSVRISDGKHLWTKSYTAGGNPNFVLNECWGLTVMPNGGYAMGCGTGIENCDPGLSKQDIADCRKGLGDKRKGAKLRNPGIWSSLVIRTDSQGNLLWQRVDSYKKTGSPPLSSIDRQVESSAAEWLIASSDGGIAVITDEGFGAGLLKLGGKVEYVPPKVEIPCAADYGSTKACCGQNFDYLPVPKKHQCPAHLPMCLGYKDGWTETNQADAKSGHCKVLPPPPPPPPPRIECAADYRKTTPCCGPQKADDFDGEPVPDKYRCPSNLPVCKGYIATVKAGLCEAAAASVARVAVSAADATKAVGSKDDVPKKAALFELHAMPASKLRGNF